MSDVFRMVTWAPCILSGVLIIKHVHFQTQVKVMRACLLCLFSHVRSKSRQLHFISITPASKYAIVIQISIHPSIHLTKIYINPLTHRDAF